MELKPIPGTLGFFADSEGNIYDARQTECKTYRNGDGYVTVNVINEYSEWETIGAHRLVAAAFHGPPTPEFYYVNHRDLDVENNRANNVEWVSCEQNNVHAEIMRRDNHRPCVYGVVAGAGFKQLFLNAWAVKEQIGIDALDVWDSIKNGTVVDGWQFFHQKYSAAIPKEVQRPRMPEKKGVAALPERAVKFRDIDSGEVVEFKSLAEAAKQFGTVPSHIHQAIPKRDVVRVLQKKYQVAYVDQEFLPMTAEQVEKAKNAGARGVIAYSYENDVYVIFSSATDFLQHTKLSKKAVTTDLAKGRLRRIGDWAVVYFDTQNTKELTEFVRGSSQDKPMLTIF